MLMNTEYGHIRIILYFALFPFSLILLNKGVPQMPLSCLFIYLIKDVPVLPSSPNGLFSGRGLLRSAVKAWLYRFKSDPLCPEMDVCSGNHPPCQFWQPPVETMNVLLYSMNAWKYTIIRTFPEGNPASNYRNVKVRN